MNITKWGAVALVTAALAATTPAFAKKDHNVLRKIGSTLQYGVRKDVSNLSVDTHRAIGHKSVVNRHYAGRHVKRVVTPAGKLKPVKNFHAYRHARYSHYYKKHH
jgi:hypothetical protein